GPAHRGLVLQLWIANSGGSFSRAAKSAKSMGFRPCELTGPSGPDFPSPLPQKATTTGVSGSRPFFNRENRMRGGLRSYCLQAGCALGGRNHGFDTHARVQEHV